MDHVYGIFYLVLENTQKPNLIIIAISESRAYFWGIQFYWLCNTKTMYKLSIMKDPYIQPVGGHTNYWHIILRVFSNKI